MLFRSETEGKHWNQDIKKMTDNQWRELVRSMNNKAVFEWKRPLFFVNSRLKKALFLVRLFLEYGGYFGSQKQQHRLYFGYHHTICMAKTDGLD